MPEEGGAAGAAAIVRVDVPAFVRELSFAALPAAVVVHAQRFLLDLIGVAAAGSRTRAAAIANAYAASQLAGRGVDARMLFDGRRASVAGAAFAGATSIDAIDAHDGHVLTKGHAGVAILPALLALYDSLGAGARSRIDGREFIACMVLGYETATRAGIALHASVADYHCSGAWNALGCAAVAARVWQLDRDRTREALGIAEYFGPRGQILRACEFPTMVKDGSGWGAHAGLSAAWLAREGFTGAPAVTVEHSQSSPHWSDLGERWRIREQYLKPHPVCRWAQPAIEGALALSREHGFAADHIVRVEIESFREAVALGSGCAIVKTTEDAQYSLPYPVAAALVFGQVGVVEIGEPALSDPRVHRLLGVMTLTEDAEFSLRFPRQRWARVRVTLADGRTLVSADARTRGDSDTPLDDVAVRAKYRALADPVLGPVRANLVEDCVDRLVDDATALPMLIDELLQPAEPLHGQAA